MSRKKLLAGVAAEVVICTLCSLSKSRKKAVPGEGDSNARVMLVGEVSGSSEDLQGRPFVGAAGKFLETLLSGIGLSREEVFICNIVKCRPPRNRPPRPLEVQTCAPYLERQMEIIKPKLSGDTRKLFNSLHFLESPSSFYWHNSSSGKIRPSNLTRCADDTFSNVPSSGSPL